MHIRVSDDSAAEQMDCRQGHGRACWSALGQQALVAVFAMVRCEQHSRDPVTFNDYHKPPARRKQTRNKTKTKKTCRVDDTYRGGRQLCQMRMLC